LSPVLRAVPELALEDGNITKKLRQIDPCIFYLLSFLGLALLNYKTLEKITICDF
jgi:hypothetical protein